MAYEALYRRYRPGRFDDMIGQAHVFATLKNSLVNDRVGHAYLFSGPRGCGKTSSARILAKALNCTDLQEGEPCDACDSCISFQSGQSYDLYELDAASNNGVDAMRDLIQKVSLGSPGRKKVYILDEVHMLSTGAENALLKTLEEPPPHVTFVLCTTEPNKVVPTVRSRTQHLEFRLYPADELADLAREVAEKAGLTVDEAGIAYAVRAAKGSARDMLSALDQVAAAGGAPDDDDQLNLIIDAIANRDSGAALTAVNEATRLGRDPEVLGRGLLSELRNAFLSSMKANLAYLSDADQQMAEHRSQQFGPAAITRAIEALGTAIIDMRQAPDPRVDLEVVLVRLTRPELDSDVAALLARIERLEREGVAAPVGGMPAPAAMAAPAPVADSVATAPVAPTQTAAPAAAAAPQAAAPAPEAYAAPAPEAEAAPAPRPAGSRPADFARQNLPKRPGARRANPTAPAAAEASPAAAPAAPVAEHGANMAPPSERPTLGSLRRAAETPGAAPQAPMQAAPQASPPMAEHQASPAAAPMPQDAMPPEAMPPQHMPPEAMPAQMPPQDMPPQHTPPEAMPPQHMPPEAMAPQGAPPAPQESMAQGGPAPQVAAAPPVAAPAAPAPGGGGSAPTLAAVEAAWNASLLTGLSGRVKSRFSAGHFRTNGATLEFALPNDVHRQRCEDVREEVDQVLAQHFGAPVAVALVVGEPAEVRESLNVAPPTDEELLADEVMNVHELKDADSDVSATLVERIEQVFPGAEIIDQE